MELTEPVPRLRHPNSALAKPRPILPRDGAVSRGAEGIPNMGFDGRMTTLRKARTLTTREAAALYGEGWECSESGAEVRQRLKLDASIPAAPLIDTEVQAVARAGRLLKRHRLAAMMIVEQLESRISSLFAIPFVRLVAGKSAAQLREQLAREKQHLAAIPEEPTVHRLDP